MQKLQMTLNKNDEFLSETLKKIDVVLCTALIPGKKHQ